MPFFANQIVPLQLASQASQATSLKGERRRYNAYLKLQEKTKAAETAVVANVERKEERAQERNKRRESHEFRQLKSSFSRDKYKIKVKHDDLPKKR